MRQGNVIESRTHLKSGGGGCSENLEGMDAFVERTGMYSQRFSEQPPPPRIFDDGALPMAKPWNPGLQAASRVATAPAPAAAGASSSAAAAG